MTIQRRAAVVTGGWSAKRNKNWGPCSMNAFLLVLSLAALPVFGEQPGIQPDAIALYLHFQQEPPPQVVSALQSEVESIMAPAGLSFDWRDLATADGGHPSPELAVITFKGRCDVSQYRAPLSDPGALGWTHISDGVILPFADIDCDAIHGFLQKELLFEPGESRAGLFGRAIGRVMAHELYHIFANTRHHGSEGAGRSTYSVRDLLSESFRFEAHESLALKNSHPHGIPVAVTDDADQGNRRF